MNPNTFQSPKAKAAQAFYHGASLDSNKVFNAEVFQLKTENMGLTKNIEVLEEQLANAMEKEEAYE